MTHKGWRVLNPNTINQSLTWKYERSCIDEQSDGPVHLHGPVHGTITAVTLNFLDILINSLHV